MHMTNHVSFYFVFYELLTCYQVKVLHHRHKVTPSKFKYFLKLISKGKIFSNLLLTLRGKCLQCSQRKDFQFMSSHHYLK